MRVAFISHYTELYGANRSLLNLIDGLAEYGITSYVIVPAEGELTTALKDRNIEFTILPFKWWVGKDQPKNKSFSFNPLKNQIRPHYYKLKRLMTNLKLIPSLANQLRQWEIDIVYTNSAVIPVGALAASYMNLSHVWHIREFCDLDYNFQFDWGNLISKYLISKANAKICISNAICSHFFSENDLTNTYIIYNGVAFQKQFDDLYNLVQNQNDYREIYTFALVGLINVNKGQEIAVRAIGYLFNKLKIKAKLILAGSGKIEHLKELAKEMGVLEYIEFWGHIDNPYNAYLASDAVLMCTQNEGMGRVTVEAMSACRPVIGYDNAGTSEIIEHEQTGLLYQGGYQELAKAMKRFIDNPEWSHQMGLKGWYTARDKYTIENYASNVYQVLTSIQKNE